MNASILIAYASLCSVFIPLGIGLFQWRWLPKNLQLIVWITLAAVLSDALSLVLINYNINTWPLGNLFLIIQFTLLFHVLGHDRKIIHLRILFYGCFAFALFDYLFLQMPKVFNSYTSYAGGILMIISALNFLYLLLAKMPVERVQTLPLFWIAFGVLIYYGGTMFLFLFNNYLMANLPKDHQAIWILHNILNITKNGFFFISLWMNYKGKTYPL